MRADGHSANNTKKITGTAFKVILMDMLCMIPYYDRYLIEALKHRIPSIVLSSISFHLDIGFFDRYGIKRMKIIDVISRLNIQNNKCRQALKAAEYIANLFWSAGLLVFNRCDIIHVQWIPLVTATSIELWFLRFAKLLGIKIVYTVHNILPHDTGVIHKAKFKKVYSLMNALICHTAQSKIELVRYYDVTADSIWVIPHGPMLHDRVQETAENHKKFLSIPEDRIVVLFFGTIRPYKGLEFLLDAWQKVAEKCDNILLVIAGNGNASYLTELKSKISAHNINEHVQTDFRYISDDKVATYFQAADILVYPYKNVTQSGALLTGMAFGKPIVASACEGFKETLNNGSAGILVEFGNVNEFARALISLILSPEERARLGKAATEELNKSYSWSAIAEKTVECYRRVILN